MSTIIVSFLEQKTEKNRMIRKMQNFLVFSIFASMFYKFIIIFIEIASKISKRNYVPCLREHGNQIKNDMTSRECSLLKFMIKFFR